MNADPVIRVDALRKSYGRTVAVDGVSFAVQQGEIFGLIGPNGAGKTTTMECVEGLRSPESGTITVLGLDPVRDVRALQERIGVQLQEAQLQKRITVREAVGLWASLYRSAVDGDRLLEQLGLAEKRNAWFMTLSGGQKQRLLIALALINDPELVFLDELTTGLDPQARRTIWELVRGIRARGKSVFLTTHLMEEAERPIPNTDIQMMDDDGNVLPIGEPGELCAKGPQVFKGYWQKDNSNVFYPGGWFKTGDIAVMDHDGYIKIVDRKKDMILVSGFNVYPNEIEGVVAAHPKVLEVAAIGIPDPQCGEAVKIVVVKKDQSLTEEELSAFCKENLTGYKRPKFIEFKTEIPKTNVGKILRRALREQTPA